ncbi:MAG TPA: oligopeptidase B, partial [Phnomibacter sp.]|nr:oligopeptidase B [Phnomibacter sp.]
MRNSLLLISILAIACQQTTMTSTPYPWPDIQAPVAPQKEHLRIIHADTTPDPYYWMIDYFKKGPDSNTVINYLKQENAYLDSMMAGTNTLQQNLFTEMKARIKEKDESVPVFKNGYYYYTRTEEGKQYYKYCRKKESLNAPEEILLDVDAMAQGYAYYDVSGTTVSDDNKLLLFAVDTVSRRQYTLYVKNLETGTLLPDVIHQTAGYGVWAADNKTIFYTSNNPITLLSEKIKRHSLNKPTEADATVYEEKDKSNYIGVGRSKDGRYIFIGSQATLSSEFRMIEASQPNAAFTVFAPRMPKVLYSVIPMQDKFLIRTNKDAQNFKLMECPLNNTNASQWKALIPHRPDVLLENADAFKNFLVITERKNGLVQLRIQNLTNNSEHYIQFNEPAYLAYLEANPEYNTDTLRYGYTSLTTPGSTYAYNMDSRVKTLLKQQEVLGGYNPNDYTTERLFATAPDGVKVPISIVYKKGFKKDGQAPLLLYAYGSYGYSMDATFSS